MDEFDLETIAVECKGSTSIHALVDAIYFQLREYQAGFPMTYLAVPEDIVGRVPEDILESYGIGLLTVGDKAEKSIPPISERSAPKLDLNIYEYSVRQKLVAYMILKEITNKNEIRYIHTNNFGFACWIDEYCNYCIHNNDVFLSRDYHLSIVIDQQKNIKRALGGANPQELYNLLENLPEDFLFSVYRVFTPA